MSAADPAPDDPTYALGRSDDEHQRLQQQAALFRPITERFFRTAGLRDGMRVLDVGSGSGDVAFLVAELVGPTGQVVGVDMDGRALATARARAERLGLGNVTFVEGDARTLDLGGEFDAAVGRLVLLYLAHPAEGLAAIAARVRRGGIVAFQEMDMDPDVPARTYPPVDALWNQTGRAIIQTFACAGVHVRMGPMLPRTFVEAGLPAPALLHECRGRRARVPRLRVDDEHAAQPAAARDEIRRGGSGGGRPGRAPPRRGRGPAAHGVVAAARGRVRDEVVGLVRHRDLPCRTCLRP